MSKKSTVRIHKQMVRPSSTLQYRVSVTENIQYGEAQVFSNGFISTVPLHLDIYQPLSAPGGLKPTILMVHGGAFLSGSRQESTLVKAARTYASHGYNVVSISYRLGAGTEFEDTGKIGPMPLISTRVQAYADLVFSVDSIRFLDSGDNSKLVDALDTLARLGQVAAMDDTLAASDWLVENADRYNFDLSRLILFGGSAGFINSLHLAYALDNMYINAPPIGAVLGFWGTLNLDDVNSSDDGPIFMESGEAPLFVVHGTDDTKIPISYGKALAARAKEVGVPIEFIPVVGGKHSFDAIDIFTTQTENGQTIIDRSIAFLDRMLF